MVQEDQYTTQCVKTSTNLFLVIKGAIRTKGGCGSSRLDTYNWRRILVSNQSGSNTLSTSQNSLKVY